MVSAQRKVGEDSGQVWLLSWSGSYVDQCGRARELREENCAFEFRRPPDAARGRVGAFKPGCGRRRGAPQSHRRDQRGRGRRQGHRPRRRRPLVAPGPGSAPQLREPGRIPPCRYAGRLLLHPGDRAGLGGGRGHPACDARRTDPGAGAISVACAAGEFAEIQAIEIRVDSVRLRPIADFEPRFRLGGLGEWAPLKDSNTDANICVEANQRSMVFQPVGFRSSATDPSPSGGTAAAQFATAAAVWNKACVSVVLRPMVFITNATLKTSSGRGCDPGLLHGPGPGRDRGLLRRQRTGSAGESTAGGIGLASCKPVIAEPNGGNPCCWRTSSDTSSTSCTRGAGRTRRRLGDGADWRRNNPAPTWSRISWLSTLPTR